MTRITREEFCKEFGEGSAFPQEPKLPQIEQTKKDIANLQQRLKLLEYQETVRTDVEKAYRDFYGHYPIIDMSMNDYDCATWIAFKEGYKAGQKPKEYQPTPQTPEQVDAGLRNAMRQAKKDGVFDEPTKPVNEVLDRLENKYENDDVVNRMLKKWEENPPDFLKFELSRSLEDRIYKWWETCFVYHPEWSMEECVEDLLDIITSFLPGEQDSSGSQNIDTVFAVEAHNELLQKIKSKLRNKK